MSPGHLRTDDGTDGALPGSADPAGLGPFGDHGQVRTPGSDTGGWVVEDLAVYPAASGALASFVVAVLGKDANYVSLVRFKPDGAWDSSFGRGRYVPLTPADPYTGAVATRVVIDADLGVLVAGFLGVQTAPPGTPAAIAFVARFVSDGTPDDRFGDAGIVEVTPTRDHQMWGDTLGLATDDARNAVAAGTNTEQGATRSSGWAAKLTLRGETADAWARELDGGNNAVVVPPLAGAGIGSAVTSVAVDADGRVVVVGATACSSWAAREGECVGFVARLLANGDRDLSFGDGNSIDTFAGGRLLLFDHLPSRMNSVAIDRQQHVVVCGAARGASRTEIVVARLLSDGSMDPSFGRAGTVSIGPAPDAIDANDLCTHVLPLPSGAIVLAAKSQSGGLKGPIWESFLRLRADGTLDDTFGDGGRVRFNLPGWTSLDPLNPRVVQGVSGELFVGAEWLDPSAPTLATIVRLSADGRR